MFKTRWPLAALCLLLMYAAPSWATSRGGYVDGMVHYFYVKGDAAFHQTCSVDESTWELSSPSGYDAQILIPNASYRYDIMATGEGIAVFNRYLFFAFTADYEGEPGKPHAYVAAYDLESGTFSSVRDMGALQTNNKARRWPPPRPSPCSTTPCISLPITTP